MSSINSIKKIKYCSSKASTCPTICELCNVFPFKGDVEVNGLRSWQVGKVVMEARLILVSGLPFQGF